MVRRWNATGGFILGAFTYSTSSITVNRSIQTLPCKYNEWVQHLNRFCVVDLSGPLGIGHLVVLVADLVVILMVLSDYFLRDYYTCSRTLGTYKV
jgi:hypothetical protein